LEWWRWLESVKVMRFVMLESTKDRILGVVTT
jgi:hypothetical protein